ncbi:MAG: TolC family protein [Desulfobacterales bacterium]|nr:TolC family protein [Desulfobacterales bacterium]
MLPRLLLSLLLMGIPIQAIASPSDPVSTVVLSMTAAVDNAMENNPGIAAARFGTESAVSRENQARAGFYPLVDFREAYNRTNNPMWAFGTRLNQETISRQDFDPARLNDPAAIDNFSSTLSMTWPIYDSGRTWHGWQQARFGSRISELTALRVRQQVTAQVIQAYLGLQLSLESKKVVDQTLDVARAHLASARNRYQNGQAVKSDLLRARVRIATIEQELIEAESRIEVARSALNAAMGQEEETAFDPATPLMRPERIGGSANEWVASAMDRRPDLQAFDRQIAVADEEITKSRAAHWPAVNLVGNYEIDTEDFGGYGDNYSIGAVVQVNLFSGKRLSEKEREARSARKEADARQKAMTLEIRHQTRAAFFEARSSDARIEVAEANIDQAAEVLRIVQDRYKNGLLPIIDLLDAEVALEQAKTNRVKATHDSLAARTRLCLAAGAMDRNFPAILGGALHPPQRPPTP